MHDYPTIKMVKGKIKGSTAKADKEAKTKALRQKVGNEVSKKK